MTNFDRIKHMGVDELAAFLTRCVDGPNSHEIGCYDCIYYGTHHSDPKNKGTSLYECSGCDAEEIGVDLVKWLNTSVHNVDEHKEAEIFVKLPCRVGDTVWMVIYNQKTKKKEIVDVVISSYSRYEFREKLTFHGWHGTGKYRTGWEIKEEDFGRLVFLTRDDAQRKIDEMSESIPIENEG